MKIYLQFFHFNYNKPFSNNLANVSKLKIKYKRVQLPNVLFAQQALYLQRLIKKTDNQFFIN